MENASKALLIAGGVLLAILILSILILTITKISDFKKLNEESIEAEQTLKFNSEYEAYNKNYLHGTEVITVFNKATDNNNKQDSNTRVNTVKVDISFHPTEVVWDLLSNLKKGIKVAAKMSSNYKLNRADDPYAGLQAGFITINNEVEMSEENFKLIKERVFYCSKIEYTNDGRVNYIKFTQGNGNVNDNLTSAESRIRDVDMAKDMVQ